MSQRKITVMECDAPGCGVTSQHDSAEPAFGIHIGRILVVSAGGGATTQAVFACKIEHIQPAIEWAIEEAWK